MLETITFISIVRDKHVLSPHLQFSVVNFSELDNACDSLDHSISECWPLQHNAGFVMGIFWIEGEKEFRKENYSTLDKLEIPK